MAFESFFYGEAPTAEEVKELLLKAACQEDDQEDYKVVVEALLRAYNMMKFIEDGEDETTKSDEMKKKEDAEQLYFKIYKKLYKGDPEGCTFPAQLYFDGVPKWVVSIAARAQAQNDNARGRAIRRYYEELDKKGGVEAHEPAVQGD